MFRNSRADYGRLWPWEYEIRKGYKQISDSFIFFSNSDVPFVPCRNLMNMDKTCLKMLLCYHKYIMLTTVPVTVLFTYRFKLFISSSSWNFFRVYIPLYIRVFHSNANKMCKTFLIYVYFWSVQCCSPDYI